jgi:hypothetical protein
MLRFPDHPIRVEYQKEREKYYKSAQQKLSDIKKKTVLLDPMTYYGPNSFTDEEKDALNYFKETGFYVDYQDINHPPCRYDTRKSLVLKMYNQEMRDEFLRTIDNK